MRLAFFSTLLIISNYVHAQGSINREENTPTEFIQNPKEDLVYQIVEVMPKFSLYEDSLSNYLHSKTKLTDGGKGIVYVRFIIDKAGKVTNPEVVKGIDEITNEAALNIVKEMPNWIPGKNNGENVNVLYSLPIKFQGK
jgi:protein TonB